MNNTSEQDPNLFSGNQEESTDPEHIPLAHRMRPSSFDDFVGQPDAVGEDTPLRNALEADRLSSLIIFGPPGCGKTALAHILARKTNARFEQLNAVLGSKDDLREIIDRAKDTRSVHNQRTVLFLDEIHRFNKAQQDALLPSVEDGTLILIGATTQNPYFYLNEALLSRSLLIEFEKLSDDQLEILLDRALAQDPILSAESVEFSPEARNHLIDHANGDARRMLNGLEITVKTAETYPIDLEQVEASLQSRAIRYDREDDQHYDVASAFIKSIRGTDPDAAIYYLAKMLEAGEDPRFIARRLVIAASEDIGNANPRALGVATDTLRAVEFVGMPEAQIPLAQATTYLASCPKSNASYMAIKKARKAIQNGLDLPVPDHLRDSHYQGAENRGHGENYKYAHDYPNHYVEQDYMAEDHTFYEPTQMGAEKKLKAHLEKLSQQEE